MDFTIPPWDRRMSTRVKNKLQRNGVMTLEDLLDCDLDTLRQRMGVVEFAIVKMKLQSLGYSVKEDP